MLSFISGILIICVVGALCFWAIDRFVNEARLANLLKLLVVLICLAAIRCCRWRESIGYSRPAIRRRST